MFSNETLNSVAEFSSVGYVANHPESGWLTYRMCLLRQYSVSIQTACFGSFQLRTTNIHSVKNLSMIEQNLFLPIFFRKRLIFAQIFAQIVSIGRAMLFFLHRLIAHMTDICAKLMHTIDICANSTE